MYFDSSGAIMYVSYGTTSGGALSRQSSVQLTSGWGTVSGHILADWDGDGKIDVLGKNNANDLLLWRNIGTVGNFAFAPFVLLGSDWSGQTKMMTGDFNGDKKIDIATWSTNGDVLSITPNTSSIGSPSRGARVTVGGGWWTVNSFWSVDFDNDGVSDILGRSGTEGFVWRVTYSGGSYVIAPLMHPTGAWNTYGRIITGDFNGDGRIDIGAYSTNGDSLTLIANTTVNHALSFAAPSAVGTGWASVSTVFTSDYDLDGYTDLIGQYRRHALRLAQRLGGQRPAGRPTHLALAAAGRRSASSPSGAET